MLGQGDLVKANFAYMTSAFCAVKSIPAYGATETTPHPTPFSAKIFSDTAHSRS